MTGDGGASPDQGPRTASDLAGRVPGDVKRSEDVQTRGLERTIFFSDAVIAIAMTLLAIELPVPEGGSNGAVWHSVGEHAGEYAAFLFSFFVVAIIWFVHHRFFQDVARVSSALNATNLVCLCQIVLIPFATKVVTDHDDIAFGPIFYASVMVVYSVTFQIMVRVVDRGGLWRAGVPPTVAVDAIWGAIPTFAVFAISIPLAMIKPAIAEFFWLTLLIADSMVERLRGLLRARSRS